MQSKGKPIIYTRAQFEGLTSCPIRIPVISMAEIVYIYLTVTIEYITYHTANEMSTTYASI